MRKTDFRETTDETVVRQPSLKQLAQQVIDRQPITSEADRQRVIIGARDAAPLHDFREALIVGRLHICANCERFTFATDPAAIGLCRLHGEALPFAVFRCSDFIAATTPSAPAYAPV